MNVLYEVKSGLWLGKLTSFTKLRHTPNDDQLISVRQRLLLLWIDTLVYLLHKLFCKKMPLIIICVRLYNERIRGSGLRGRRRIPYWCFPRPCITGFTFVLCFLSINSVIQFEVLNKGSFWLWSVYPFPLAEVDYDDEHFVTLMDVLTYSEVSYLFPTVLSFFFFFFYASR